MMTRVLWGWLRCAVVMGALAMSGQASAQYAQFVSTNRLDRVGSNCANPSSNGVVDWRVDVHNAPLDWVPVLLRTPQLGVYRFGGNVYPAVCDGQGRWPMALATFAEGSLAGWNLYIEPWNGSSPLGGYVYLVDANGTMHPLLIQ